jgi:uncharacterized protein (TIGR03435 family)
MKKRISKNWLRFFDRRARTGNGFVFSSGKLRFRHRRIATEQGTEPAPAESKPQICDSVLSGKYVPSLHNQASRGNTPGSRPAPARPSATLLSLPSAQKNRVPPHLVHPVRNRSKFQRDSTRESQRKNCNPYALFSTIARQTIMHTLRSLAIWLCFAAFGASAQTPAPAFEVAAIKPAAPGAPGSFIRNTPGGRLNVTNMTLKDLVVMAYRIQPFQVSGGPPWFEADHWDIEAKAEGNPGQDERALMFQSLLADRFALKFHRETKEVPVYELVVAKPTGKPFAGLTETKEGSCVPPDPSGPPPQPGAKPPCRMIRMGINQLHASSQTLANFTQALSRLLGRTVIDKTGLKGNFDIALEWAPDQTQALQLPPDAPKPPVSDPSGPTIFTAIQEQLGLKLESKKGPVDIFVIDHAEKPSAN